MANDLPVSMAQTPVKKAVRTTPKWRKRLIRMQAFLTKEINEMRRQPKLLLSLVGGPFMVLLLFGMLYGNIAPTVETILVLPADRIEGLDQTDISGLLGDQFKVVEVTADDQAALARLNNHEVDLVQIIPDDVRERVLAGQGVTLEFQSNAVDPTVEAWLQYLAYTEANEVNRSLLQVQARNAQNEAVELRVQLAAARDPLTALSTLLAPEELTQTADTIHGLTESLSRLEAMLPPGMQTDTSQESQLGQIYRGIVELRSNLGLIEDSIAVGSIHQQSDLIQTTLDQFQELDGLIDTFTKIPPDAIVSPIQTHYTNLRGQAYDSFVFYAPGVLALLIQHVSVTLGALALVRERLAGTFEIFRIAPLNSPQMLIGKYLGYSLFVGIAAVALLILMRFINIPLLGSLADLAGMMLLTILASLGVGFLISLISDSDRQAIQYTMLVLLLSVFFSGIFLALDSFLPGTRYLSSIIPMTHAVQGFSTIMLKGTRPAPGTWAGLSAISIIAFWLVLWLTQRAFRDA